jgi:hypothetical protein
VGVPAEWVVLYGWPDDDLRWIDPTQVGDIVRLIQDILAQLAVNLTTWTRE